MATIDRRYQLKRVGFRLKSTANGPAWVKSGWLRHDVVLDSDVDGIAPAVWAARLKRWWRNQAG